MTMIRAAIVVFGGFIASQAVYADGGDAEDAFGRQVSREVRDRAGPAPAPTRLPSSPG